MAENIENKTAEKEEKLTWQHVPPMSLDDMRRTAAGIAVGNLVTTVLYLKSKYGEAAVEDYLNQNAKEQAAILRENQVESPVALLTLTAKQERELFGSKIELTGNDDKAVLTFAEDKTLEVFLEELEAGRYPDLHREWYLELKNDGVHRRVAGELGFKFGWEDLGEKGYRITVYR